MKTILDFKSFKMNERFNIDEYDPEIAEWEIELQNSIKKLERLSKDVKLINTKAMDNIKGPFATVEILGDTYKVWSESNDRLFIEDFIIDNTDEDLKISGFIGTIEEIADTINNMEQNESNSGSDTKDDNKSFKGLVKQDSFIELDSRDVKVDGHLMIHPDGTFSFDGLDNNKYDKSHVDLSKLDKVINVDAINTKNIKEFVVKKN